MHVKRCAVPRSLVLTETMEDPCAPALLDPSMTDIGAPAVKRCFDYIVVRAYFFLEVAHSKNLIVDHEESTESGNEV